MDRRRFLSLKQSNTAKIQTELDVQTVQPPSSGLAEYKGSWDFKRAWHLLARTTFGPTEAEIKESETLGLSESVSKLLDIDTSVDQPLSINRNDDNSPYGETFVDKSRSFGMESQRRRSLLSWWGMRMGKARFDISEKMTIFWSNHYATEVVLINDARYSYQLYKLLRENCLGNFRELTKEVTVNTAMLVYLNGNRNIARQPNENYARELFELFTVGKGTQVSAEDYTNYTEDDIRAASRVLTGWTINRRAGNDLEATFQSLQHDKTPKTFTAVFGNRTITNAEDEEYKQLIDMIYESDNAAKFLARKLYIYFVNDYINDTVQANVIDPLAQIIYDNDYEIKPALETLLKSEHFNDTLMLGSMIKTPFDYIFDVLNKLDFDLSSNNFAAEYNNYYSYVVGYAAAMDQTLNEPPSVAGWQAYYQQPLMYRMWLNSVTIQLRQKITDGAVYIGLRNRDNQTANTFDPIEMAKKSGDPGNDSALIDYFTNFFYPVPISDGKREQIRKTLVPDGSPSYVWNYRWAEYEANPDDETKQQTVSFMLLNFFSTVLASAENHIN